MKTEKRAVYQAPQARISCLPPGVNFLTTFSLSGEIEDLERGELEDGDGWGAFD